MCSDREELAVNSLDVDQLTFVLRLILAGWGLNDALLAMDDNQKLSWEES